MAAKGTKFEDAIERLEKIVDQLDSEQLQLDSALKLFEEGIELLRSASNELAAAEAKVKLLVEKADGVFETRDFGG